MDATAVAAALVEWVTTTCPDLAGSYAFDPDAKTQPLPDVAAYITSETEAQGGEALGFTGGIDQARVHTLNANVLLMVDPTDAQAATEQLQTFVAQLAAALKADQTLGLQRIAASPDWSASYEPPFIRFDDGTEGRAATFSMTVSELA